MRRRSPKRATGRLRRAAVAGLAAATLLAPAALAAPRHVFLIVMENRTPEEILGNPADAPFLDTLIRLPGAHTATNYFGVTHPSLPNYLALLSGSTQGIFDDCEAGRAVTCRPAAFVPGTALGPSAGRLLADAQAAAAASQPHLFAGSTLVDRLEGAGRSWAAYFQSLPPDDKLVAAAPHRIPLYAQKHNPFVYFAAIRDDPQRLARIRPGSALAADLAAGRAADLVWIVPDQCHDMHGLPRLAALAVGEPACADKHGATRLGDAYLRDVVTLVTGSPAWREGAALIIVWDESDADIAGTGRGPLGRDGAVLGGGRTPLILLTDGREPAASIDAALDHYDLLAAIQGAFGLGCLEGSCRSDWGNPLALLLRQAGGGAAQ